jgi:hypothetical protein
MERIEFCSKEEIDRGDWRATMVVDMVHYYIWADYSTKIFHTSTSFIIFLKRAGFSWIFPRTFVAISTKILI